MRILAAVVLLCAAASGEVIDRVAVSFGHEVVTLGAIRRQLRMSAYTSGKPPEDTPEARRAAAERLIDQALVKREMELSRYTPIPMADVAKNVEEYREKLGLAPERFAEELARYGFSTDEFVNEIYWQATLLRFVQFRFSPSVQVSEDEIQEYYEREYLPRLRAMAPGQEPPPLAEVRERVTGILASQKENAALEQWLRQGRQQARIRYHEEAFQ
jgi:hypothetical protein